jgi:hypothetical protein
MFFVLKFELILKSAQIMCLRRAPEKYIAGAALDRAGLDNVGSSTSLNLIGLNGLLLGQLFFMLMYWLIHLRQKTCNVIIIVIVIIRKTAPFLEYSTRLCRGFAFFFFFNFSNNFIF